MQRTCFFFFVERHALAGVIIASDDADAARRLSRTAAVLNISGFSFFVLFFFGERRLSRMAAALNISGVCTELNGCRKTNKPRTQAVALDIGHVRAVLHLDLAKSCRIND